jgi:hypothetical protein
MTGCGTHFVSALCQGMTLVVPDILVNFARDSAEKLISLCALCRGTTLVVPQAAKMNIGFSR